MKKSLSRISSSPSIPCSDVTSAVLQHNLDLSSPRLWRTGSVCICQGQTALVLGILHKGSGSSCSTLTSRRHHGLLDRVVTQPGLWFLSRHHVGRFTLSGPDHGVGGNGEGSQTKHPPTSFRCAVSKENEKFLLLA